MSEDFPTKSGLEVIKEALETLPDSPGVYRMIDKSGQAVYVGKARSLKKRVRAYTKLEKLPVRLQRMVTSTTSMEFVHTHTEAEALLLEANYIKQYKPRYNILLRDDKSFPYILITDNHEFPRITRHRGAKTIKGDYFGPFASAHDVNRTMVTLQKAFMLRNCTDSYFTARSRPCLQYHIKRCTAPCTGVTDKHGYIKQVSEAKDFLSGKSKDIQKVLSEEMSAASEALDYESAAKYRDRIAALSTIQAHQNINVSGISDADVMGLYRMEESSCIQVFFFRGGQNFGNRSYFIKHDAVTSSEEIIGAFVPQFYENKPVPSEILLSHTPEEKKLLEEALSASTGKKIHIRASVRGVRKELLDFVLNNAKEAMDREMASKTGTRKIMKRVCEIFDLDEVPKRIEVYDNSHIAGTNMVGAMIVAGPDGFNKNAYRKFNIRNAKTSDDYGMMREVMERRFSGALKETENDREANWPDLLLIDGGKGQLSSVTEVLEDLGILDRLCVAGIAKGPDRNAGRESFFLPGKEEFKLPIGDPALLYLQSLRDEAHRFAIGSHRAKRNKGISRSALDEIPGIGPKRKKALLSHFGSAKVVANAGLKDLQNVEGISWATAEIIYNFFHK